MNDKVFRTYLKGNGKKSAEKHKGIDQVRTFEDASQFKSYGAILNDGFVDISFDSPELSDAFMNMCEAAQWNCLVLENPDNKHIHTYWKDSKGKIKKKGYTDAVLAVGLIADIHSGETYIPLCVDEVQREEIFDKDPDADYDEVPDELIPVNTTVKLWEMREGDGRDSALYGYENVIASQVTKDSGILKRIVNNINQFIFAEPLSDADIERITRDDAIPQNIPSKNFVFTDFGDDMIRQFNIKKIDNRLHIYHEGIYISNQNYIENAMVRTGGATLNSSKRTEVLKYLNIKILKNASTLYHEDLIAFENGILDLNSGELLPFSPDYIILNKIPWNYVPGAYDKAADDTINRICSGNQDIRMLLEEMVGYCFYRSNKFRKSFILTGKGKNGKSTFLKMLRYALDKDSDDNVSSLDLNDLNDRFSKVRLYGKLANIGDDIAEDDLHGKGISIFKKAVTGEAFTVEFKGQDGFDMKSYATLIFAANTIPRFSGSGLTAIKDRLVIIPFEARFTKDGDDYNPNIIKDLMSQSAIEYLIMLGVQGLQRIIQNQGFTEPDIVTKELDDFEANNDSILAWLDNMKESDEDSIHDVVDTMLVGRNFDDIYGEYEGFCVMEGIKENMVARRNFSKEICSRVDGLEKCRLNDSKRSTTYKWT